MLSILIPVYNYDVAPLVGELHKQCMAAGISFEILVLEDASAQKFNNASVGQLQGVNYLENTANLGRAASRHKMAQIAKYEKLLFLDADVMPASADFIQHYTGYLSSENPVIVGGIAYRKQDNLPGKALRYKYGVEREQKTASERSKNPYGAIVTANLLIEKGLFLQHNYTGNENLYGLDILFSYRLFNEQVPIIHTDNPVYHLGIETDIAFFAKALQAVASRRQFLANVPDSGKVNGLLKHYKMLKGLGLTGITAVLFKTTEPFLKKRILSDKPDLLSLDLYRLGYMCTLQ